VLLAFSVSYRHLKFGFTGMQIFGSLKVFLLAHIPFKKGFTVVL